MSARVIKEGGYEVTSSLAYYGLYGPFRIDIEDLLVNRAKVIGDQPARAVKHRQTLVKTQRELAIRCGKSSSCSLAAMSLRLPII